MPGRQKGQHTAKADRMAEHIEESAREEGRYKGREKQVAWATVQKELSKSEAHGGGESGRTKRSRK